MLFVLAIIFALLYIFTMMALSESVRNGTWYLKESNVGIIFILNRIFKWGAIIFILAFIIKLIV